MLFDAAMCWCVVLCVLFATVERHSAFTIYDFMCFFFLLFVEYRVF